MHAALSNAPLVNTDKWPLVDSNVHMYMLNFGRKGIDLKTIYYLILSYSALGKLCVGLDFLQFSSVEKIRMACFINYI